MLTCTNLIIIIIIHFIIIIMHSLISNHLIASQSSTSLNKRDFSSVVKCCFLSEGPCSHFALLRYAHFFMLLSSDFAVLSSSIVIQVLVPLLSVIMRFCLSGLRWSIVLSLSTKVFHMSHRINPCLHYCNVADVPTLYTAAKVNVACIVLPTLLTILQQLTPIHQTLLCPTHSSRCSNNFLEVAHC